MTSNSFSIERLTWDNYRGVAIAPTQEFATLADEVIKPGYLPPVDVIYIADAADLQKHKSKLLGRPFFVLFTGLDEHTLWFHSMAEQLIKAMSASPIYFAMPNGTLIQYHDGKPEITNINPIELMRASDVKIEAIRWLWNGWLAGGKMHILGGSPGTGKTAIGIAFAAAITVGGLWPDGTKAPLGSVLIWSGEDDVADTLVPRLVIAGADLNKVFFISSIRDGEGKRPFDPAKDISFLTQKLRDIGDVALLIVDPIVSAVMGDGHKNAETRRALQPLVDLGMSERCAILGITHFTKSTAGKEPLERITGSLAFGALARIVFVAAKETDKPDSEQPGRRLFLRVKSNIGPDDSGFVYDLNYAAVPLHRDILSSNVIWHEAVQGSARQLLSEIESSAENKATSAVKLAMDFLLDLLKDGAVPSKQIEEEGHQAGHSWKTLTRAKDKLGIQAVKTAMKGPWYWYPPNTKNAIPAEESQ